MMGRGLVGKFLRLPLRQKTCLVEAAILMGLVRLALLLLPFRIIAGCLGRQMEVTPEQPLPLAWQRQQVREVTDALRQASGNLPWECKCLVQAVTGKLMLRRRGIASTLYLGVAREGDANSQLIAHAWLRAGEELLTGAEGRSRYSVISSFS